MVLVANGLNSQCITNSGPSTESGLHVWCWESFNIPTDYNKDYVQVDYIGINSHCNTGMVTTSGDRIYFKVNPTTPEPQSWCGENFNYRAEIRDTPSDPNHPLGTEQWFGFNYTFGSDYKIDTVSEWGMWQVHSGSGSPPLQIQIRPARSGQPNGMMWLANHAINDGSQIVLTSLNTVPTANTSLDIVIHLVSEIDSTGLLQIWINGSLVYDENVKTCYTNSAYGGYVKYGIYKWPWKNESDVNASAVVGVTELNTSIGTLRTLKRNVDDPDYLKDAYDLVLPSGGPEESVTANAGEDVSICEGESATLTATGGTDYLWSTGETSVSIQVSPDVTTTYTVTVSSNGISDSDQVTVNVNPLPTANAGADIEICQGESVTLTAADGANAYLWNTGQTGKSVTVSPEDTTTYTVTVTDNGCSATDDVTVTVKPRPAVNAGNDMEITQGGSATLTASGEGTFVWSTGQQAQSITVSPTATTIYTVTATSNGCTNSDSVTVVVLEPDSVTANAGDDVSICDGNSAALTATGGTEYLWSTGETTASIQVSPAVTTTYTVTVSSNGISDSDEVIVNVKPLPTADAGADLEICQGESVTLTAAGGGSSYAWNTGQTGQSITVSPEDTTTYTVTVTDNGCTDTDDVTVTVRPRPVVNAGNDMEIGQGDSATLTASGDGTFVWSTGEEAQSITVSPTATTVYTVTATLNGCTNSDSVTVVVLEPDSVTANAGDDVSICEGESVTLTATGGTDYLWSTGETSASIQVSPDVTTTYIVTVSKGSQFDTDLVTVYVNDLPIADAGNDITIEQGQNTTLIASGGNSYYWSTGETTQAITVGPNETAIYSVIVSLDECSSEDEVKVTVVEPVNASAGEDTNICKGGSITLTATGGLEYLWNTGETSASIVVTPTHTTTYSVIVSNGISEQEAEVTVNVNSCSEKESLDFEDDTYSPEFSVWPNPTKGIINVKLTQLFDLSSLQLYDILGKVLISKSIESIENQIIKLDLSHYSKGIYILTIIQNGKPFSRRVILY